MFKPENNLSRFKQALLPYTFLVSLIVSVPITIGLGYLVRINRDIKEYKQGIFWYENLSEETDNSALKVFESFVKEAQKQLRDQYGSDFKNAIKKNFPGIPGKIITEKKGLVLWEVEKTGESISVDYSHTRVIDFKTPEANGDGDISQEEKEKRKQEKEQSRNDKVFQAFTKLLTQGDISSSLEQPSSTDGIYNLRNFSDVVIDDFLTDKQDNKDYSSLIPNLKVNNIYILKVSTGFLISYPASDQDYPETIDFENRPWFRATKKKYDISFFERDKYDNESAITGIYIDVNDKDNKPNSIRTLWYKFKPIDSDEQYILCFDFFLDKSGQTSSDNNLTYLLQMLLSEGNWKYLLPLSLLLALCLSLIYELIIKDIFRRISKSSGNDFPRIAFKLHKKSFASQDANEINFAITGETKKMNQSGQSIEAGWFLSPPQISFGISRSQSHTKQQEATVRYEFTNSYDLNMSQNKPLYKCIETWKVVSESPNGNSQDIGSFVAKWNTSNSADPKEVLDIQSIYWEREHEKYLDIFKEQLRNHLLISEAPELVAVLDLNYSIQQNIPKDIQEIDIIKITKDISEDLKQRKIIFSDFETLTDLYKKGTVNAICTLHFLKQLKDLNKLKDFFETSVSERYLIEYKQGEFKDFYNSLDNETKTELLNKSPFKIMVYQDNIDNIVSAQDDFCIISIKNTPRLVAYSFTDNKFTSTGGIGWISWREVDIKFYDELYKCQLNKNHRIEDITTYLS